MPTRGILPARCASAASGAARRASATIVQRGLTFIGPSPSPLPSPLSSPQRGEGTEASLPARGQRVEARAVVPEDLRLRLVADPFQRQELIDRLGKQAVGGGVVSRGHDVVVSNRLHHL